VEDEVGGACTANGGEEDRVWDTDRKAREKETTRKTNAEVNG
jgi:hypothetical protein